MSTARHASSLSNIRAAARLADRDVRQVHTNLDELASLHLLEFETDGRRKRPPIWYDSIAVDLPLDTPAVARDHANA